MTGGDGAVPVLCSNDDTDRRIRISQAFGFGGHEPFLSLLFVDFSFWPGPGMGM
jgi:hypothetical protein